VLAATALTVALAIAEPAAGSASAPSRDNRPATLTGSASKTWTVSPEVDTNPLATPARPRPGAKVHPLTAGCAHAAPDGTRPGPRGEGLIALTMAAPGTSWGSKSHTSVDVEVSVDGQSAQQIVLFDGSQPFTYEGFLGRLGGGSHCVRVTIEANRSSDTGNRVISIYNITLGIVPRSSSAFELMLHAPVVFGRSTSAERNAQILTYGQATPNPNGRDTDLSYTVIWTREDVGDGIIPAYEWGLFGRMTDIETVLDETVSPRDKILKAKYLSCGCEKFPIFPDELPAPPVDSEIDKPYPKSGTPHADGRHLKIRDATGNNDISPYGTTRFRFQQVPVAGPRPGESREVAMDTNPWTYRISQLELGRSTTHSTNADSLLAGNYPQYLIVDINATAAGTHSIAIGVKIAGSSTWYTNDYAQTTAPGPPSTFPFYDGGHARTVIKLPPGWHNKRITALRLVLNADRGSPMGRLDGKPAITLIDLSPRYRVSYPKVPKPIVLHGIQLLPDLPV